MDSKKHDHLEKTLAAKKAADPDAHLEALKAAGKPEAVERIVLDRAMPNHLIALLMEAVEVRQGMNIRPDIRNAANVASVKDLTHVNDFRRRALAERIDKEARIILDGLHVSDVRHGLVAWCVAVNKAAVEGLHPEPTNQAVMLANAIVTEAKEDPENWRPEWMAIRFMSGKMFDRARLLGYFCQTPVETPGLTNQS